jgi:nephrocystin-3
MIEYHHQMNRQLRVFLSSTFKDMHLERDYLNKHIFPEVAKEAYQRGVYFSAIDLRWGITEEEVNQGDVIRICLEEIDRCRPFFIGFLGERYGWVPQNHDIKNNEELLNSFPMIHDGLIQNKSITEMEILHGVLESKIKIKGSFFFRSKAFTHQLAKEYINDYFEVDIERIEKLKTLKSKILDSDSLVNEYHQLEELGEILKKQLLDLLDEIFPKNEIKDSLERQRISQRLYANQRAFNYLHKESSIRFLDDFYERAIQSKSFSSLVIYGQSGLGKSALLCYWMGHLINQKKQVLFIEHYMGISGSRSPQKLLLRLILELKSIVQKITPSESQDNEKQSEDINDLKKQLIDIISYLPLDQKILIVIDAINQIESNTLNWLPHLLPPQVCLIVSTISGVYTHELHERGYEQFEVQPMNIDERLGLIHKYLSFHGKKLSHQQAQKIAQSPQCANPLFLNTTLAELLVFGRFEKLDQFITSCIEAKDLDELFNGVLERLEKDYGESLTQHILTMIWASRNGLSEEEFILMTQMPRLKLMPFLLVLENHLMINDGLLEFSHDYLRTAVKKRYLYEDEWEIKAYSDLADQWLKQTEMSYRKSQELPWLLEKSNRLDDLADLLDDLQLFKLIYRFNEYELLHYWIIVNHLKNLEHTYLSMLNAQNIDFDSDVDDFNQINTIKNICQFLQTAGFYQSTIQAMSWVLKVNERKFGVEHPQTLKAVNQLANLLAKKSDFVAAEKLYRRALEGRERILGLSNPQTLKSVNQLGSLLLKKNDLNGAESLFRRALEEMMKHFGMEHPQTFKSLNHLGTLLVKKGDLNNAEKLFQQALEGRERILGPNHPQTIKSKNHLGALLRDQGNLYQAEQLCRDALASNQKILGPEHPNTLASMHDLSIILSKQGNEEGESVMRYVFETQSRILGINHHHTTKSAMHLYRLLLEKGLDLQAKSFYDQYLGHIT